jgi:hypothetical protein
MFVVIASQAIITGVFSLVSQASSLGYSPPFRVIHTSKIVIGQIYVPVRLISNFKNQENHFHYFIDYQLDSYVDHTCDYSLLS